MKTPIISILLVFMYTLGMSQKDTIHWDLTTYLDLVLEESLEGYTSSFIAYKAQADRKIARASFGPQLETRWVLPQFQSDTLQQQWSQIALEGYQVLASTGGRLGIQSQVGRWDDFGQGDKIFSSMPIRVSYLQPIGQFNPYKWDKKRIDIDYAHQSKVSIATHFDQYVKGVSHYFDFLLAQVNLELSWNNEQTNNKLMAIAKKRLELGSISKADYLQLQLEYNNAKSQVLEQSIHLETARRALFAYTLTPTRENLLLSVPDFESTRELSAGDVWARCLEVHPRIEDIRLTLLEAERWVEQSRKARGLNMDVEFSWGRLSYASDLEQLLPNAQHQYQIGLGVQIPIYNGGSLKQQEKLAIENQRYQRRKVEQDRADLEAEIYQLVFAFNQLQERIIILRDSRDIALERYDIATQRYVLGDISVTDLSIARQEKDFSQRQYIGTLYEYWMRYYTLIKYTGGQLPI